MCDVIAFALLRVPYCVCPTACAPLRVPHCRQVVKNDKDCFDRGLSEVRTLRLVRMADMGAQRHVMRILDYFYFREHLLIVTELLQARHVCDVCNECNGADAGPPPPHTCPPASTHLACENASHAAHALHASDASRTLRALPALLGTRSSSITSAA